MIHEQCMHYRGATVCFLNICLCLVSHHSPTIVCLVRASWLICMFCSSSCPSGSVCLSLKWSTSAGGFFHSTWIETSVCPRTWISSTAETSGRWTASRNWHTDEWKLCLRPFQSFALLWSHVFELRDESLPPWNVTFLQSRKLQYNTNLH